MATTATRGKFTRKGIVKDFIGKKGAIEFVDTNLAGPARVMVTIIPEKGESIECFLGTTLSAMFRAKEVTVGNLLTFDYGVNENNHWYIVRPEGKKVRYEAEKLTATEFKPVAIDIEDYIAL